MEGEINIKFMRRCLELAAKAEGMTYPNPMVGSVIVCRGKIIGEGFHLRAGESHAEVNAINSVSEKGLLKESTLYVNLEPCSHFGRTPPCADLIASLGIPKVVIGSTDTNSKVSGKGIAKLLSSGCEVITGVIEEECRWLNRRFFTFHEKKRPYIILKWAESADGFIDIERQPNLGQGINWITGDSERVLVHKWRAQEQSILVGAGTIRADNPRLDVREWTGKNPLRLVLSGSGNLSCESAVFNKNGRVIVFTSNSGSVLPDPVIIIKDSNKAAEEIAEYLFSTETESLFIEGGAEVLQHFIDCGLWDEARIFTGDVFFMKGIRAPELYGVQFLDTRLSRSRLKMIANKQDKSLG